MNGKENFTKFNKSLLNSPIALKFLKQNLAIIIPTL